MLDPSSQTPSRRGSRVVLFSLLAALATIAVGSTVVALRTRENLTRSQQDFSQAMDAVDRYSAALLTNGKLKEKESVRRELLQPVLEYYQGFVQTHSGDDKALRAVTSAQLHLAAVQAKMGSKTSVATLSQGVALLNRLAETPADPQTFPSVQESALKLVTPTDWSGLKAGATSLSQQEILTRYFTFSATGSSMTALSKKYPQVVSFRSDLAGLHRTMAMLSSSAAALTSMPTFRQQSLASWLQSRDVLETLVRDQSANVDFKTRLVEALVSAAKIQKGDGARDAAIANDTRAVELRQQLAAAAPADEALQKDLATLQNELEKLKAAPVAAKASPAATPAKAKESPAAGEPAAEK